MNEPGAALRMGDGFRQRGVQVTRLEAFIDAAFAFAVTLLVISLDQIPNSIEQLFQALRGVPAFAMAFLLIGLFWYQHARWSRRYGLDDAYSTLLGFALVFLVLVYVYPLKILTGLFFAWITQGWTPWPMRVTGYGDIRDVFIIYGIGYASLSLCIAELHAHALRQRRALQLDRHEATTTAADVAIWRLAALIGLISIVIAASLPATVSGWIGALPGFAYFLMNLSFLAGRVAARRMERRLAVESG